MKRFFGFLVGAREELKKVSWPSRDEVSKFTFVTVLTVVFFSIFLWLVDFVLTKLITMVMH